LRDRKHKTKRRKSKQTRNKAAAEEEENQIGDLTRDFKGAATIPSIANDACSADQ
jgi:hypothetical protein